MARGINKVILVGNLGEDPDVRLTEQGNPIAKFSVATDESYKDRSTGEMIQKTEWHRIVVFGRTAEVAAQYLVKGSKVYLEGRLQTRRWTDGSGCDRYTTEVVIGLGGRMLMLGSPSEGSSKKVESNTMFNGDTPLNSPKDHECQSDDIPFDDDLPF